MSSYQYVIDNATSLQITYQDITNGTISRNGNITQGTVYGVRPYTIECSIPPYLDATDEDVRGLIAHLDKNALVNAESINIGSTNTGLSYITEYKGNASTTALNDLTLCPLGRPGQANYAGQPGTVTPSITHLTLGQTTVLIESSAVYFKTGDFIQLNNTTDERVYQVAGDVTGTGFYASGISGLNVIDVPINRVYNTLSYINQFPTLGTPEVLVGSAVNFTVNLINKPRYTLAPGGPNNVMCQFQDNFVFAERMTND